METFTNNPLTIERLPHVGELSLQPVEPDFRKILIWRWLISWSIVLVSTVFITTAVNELHSFSAILIITLFFALLSSFSFWLLMVSFKRKAYAIREHDIVYRSGWLVQRLAVCPFSRIQHCSVSAGPLERKLRLASLYVFTAGTGGADIRIPGLKETVAATLCDFILEKTRAHEQAGN